MLKEKAREYYSVKGMGCAEAILLAASEEYQLNAPDLTVEVEDSEGNQQTLAFGMESVSGGKKFYTLVCQHLLLL